MPRLVDLAPRWMADPGRQGQGISFGCPVCGPRCRLAALFSNPIDGGAAVPITPTSQTRWTRTGDIFETLTLAPSLHFLDTGRCPSCDARGLRWEEGRGHAEHDAPGGGRCTHSAPATHWHGHIINGVVC